MKTYDADLQELDARTCADLVREHAARLYPLNQLSVEALARLMPALRAVRYPAKASLYGFGESPEHDFYVLSGCVCLYDRRGSSPQVSIRPDPADEMTPLPYAVPSDERALVNEDSILLLVDRMELARATERADAPAAAAPVVPRPEAPAPASAAQVSAPAANPGAVAEMDEVPGRGSRVLQVGHPCGAADSCRTLLKSIGLRSDWAHSAEEAAELLQIESYAVVLLDLQLPDGDAFDVVRSITERRHDSARPRIIALADALHDDRKGCLAAGIDEVLFKPVSEASMRAVLERGAGHATLALPAAPASATAVVRSRILDSMG